MKKVLAIFFLILIMSIGFVNASEEKVFLKNAPDYELFYNNGKVAILSHIKTDKAVSKETLDNNNLISRYQVYLPLYIEVDNSTEISKVILMNNGQNISTEKELKLSRSEEGYETSIEQVVGMPDGVGMIAETIYQNLKVYKYKINWTYRDFTKTQTSLDVVVIREIEASEYDYIYENMINKAYQNIYSKIMSMTNTDLSVLETYLAAKYGVEWDIDAKISQEMRELNIAKIDFSDITAEHWAYNVVKSMAIKGILVGYEDKTFRPESNLTRAEAAQILTKYFNLSEINNGNIEDLTENHWAYDAIKKASLFIRMNGNKFDGDVNITRKDFIISIMNIKDYKQVSSSNVFNDINELNQDEIEKINLAYSLNIVKGYEDNSFRPNDFITRAEACAILSRAN